jgi:hypothetical protein
MFQFGPDISAIVKFLKDEEDSSHSSEWSIAGWVSVLYRRQRLSTELSILRANAAKIRRTRSLAGASPVRMGVFNAPTAVEIMHDLVEILLEILDEDEGLKECVSLFQQSYPKCRPQDDNFFIGLVFVGVAGMEEWSGVLAEVCEAMWTLVPKARFKDAKDSVRLKSLCEDLIWPMENINVDELESHVLLEFAAISEPDSSFEPTNHRDGLTVNQRMLLSLESSVDRTDWSLRRWASFLRCSPAAVANTTVWKGTRGNREASRELLKKRSRMPFDE